jgi:type II secretory pathway pseudopilin PulG
MKSAHSRRGESGYVLLAVMLTLTLMLIALSIEAPRIVQQIKREKEEEMVHRGRDYATAVKRFVHKNGGQYPTSVEQLENTNHIRFLRKKYKDPMTGEPDWKMVHVGEAEIKIPVPNPGLSGGGGTNPGLFGSGQSQGSSGGGTGTGTGTASTGTTPNGQAQTQSTLTTSNIGNGQTVGGGPIIGVASTKKVQSIKEFNDKDHYDEWYFVYDLRLEQSGGSGVTVAAPRGANSATGSTTGAAGTPNATGSQNPSTDSGVPTPTGQPTPPGQPTPTGTPTPPPQTPN